MCFSPEKRNLFSEISTSEDGSGCEIKKYKRGNGDDIIINDWSSVKKAKLSFTAPIIAKKYLTIAQINNECSLYDLVNTEACLYNLSNEKLVEKNGITIRLKQASINDKTDIIPITIFGDLVDKVEDKTVYCFGNLRVSKYQSQRLLKTMDSSTITVSVSLDPESFTKKKDLVDSTSATVTGKIVSVNTKSLLTQLRCSMCKHTVEVNEEDLVECEKCQNISVKELCQEKTNVTFTLLNSNTKARQEYCAPGEIITSCFEVTLDDTKMVARSMLNVQVLMQVNVSDNVVIFMQKE